MAHFNYTHRFALALLQGRLGVENPHLSWLNEFVPTDNPKLYAENHGLGAILSVMPFLFLPAHYLTALIAGTCVAFFYLLGGIDASSTARRIVLALFPVFGTWSWATLGFAGTPVYAQGFGMIGQAGALYFTLRDRRPVIAGCFFALAFGNRTELILTLPVYLLLLKRDRLRFLIVPVILAALTASHNYARFHNPLEFGYHRQHLMQEGWCQHGLFSLYPVLENLYHTFLQGLIIVNRVIQPSPWGFSIFLASPFLFLLFREGGKYKAAAWTAIGILMVALLCHCSQGGWGYSSRYAMVLLPWMFLIVSGNGTGKLTTNEIALFSVSVAISAFATWLFLWTHHIELSNLVALWRTSFA